MLLKYCIIIRYNCRFLNDFHFEKYGLILVIEFAGFSLYIFIQLLLRLFFYIWTVQGKLLLQLGLEC